VSYADFQYFDVQVSDGVAVITARDEFLTVSRHAEMLRMFDAFAADDGVGAVVLTGAGDGFCTAIDPRMIERLVGDEQYVAKSLRDGREIPHRAAGFDKPVIAALSGDCTILASFVLLADIIVVERHVRIADRHVTPDEGGTAAGDGGVLVWPLAVGLIRAKRHLLTGDPITAGEAFQAGLVSEVVDRGAALERALEYARRMTDPVSALGVRCTKRALNQWLRLGLTTAGDFAAAMQMVSIYARPVQLGDTMRTE
jgi:enoyl-CoA hydratase